MTTSAKNDERATLRDVVMKHFMGTTEKQAGEYAEELLGTRDSAAALEGFEGANREPAKDYKSIRLAAKAVNSAHAHLSQVGWHGQKTFADIVTPLVGDQERENILNSGAASFSGDALLRITRQLAQGLQDAVDQVNLEGMSPMTAFGPEKEFEQFKNSKPAKTTARYLARECAQLFYQLTGQAPTVRNHEVPFGSGRVANEAYGPFLDFVADVFEAAEVNASPETWAKKAVRDFSPENSEKAP